MSAFDAQILRRADALIRLTEPGSVFYREVVEGAGVFDLVGEETKGGGMEEVAAGPAFGPVAHVDGQAEVVPAGEEEEFRDLRLPLGAE